MLGRLNFIRACSHAGIDLLRQRVHFIKKIFQLRMSLPLLRQVVVHVPAKLNVATDPAADVLHEHQAVVEDLLNLGVFLLLLFLFVLSSSYLFMLSSDLGQSLRSKIHIPLNR